jgi:cephalosporin hydroxylase
MSTSSFHPEKPNWFRRLRSGLRRASRFARLEKAFGDKIANEYRQRLKVNLYQWLVHHQKNIVFQQSRWMGVNAYKNPMDAWIYQELLHELRPDYVVEIGSANGGTTLYLAHLCDLIGRGTIISIDIDRSRYAVEHPRIKTFTGDSSSPEIFNAVRDLVRDGKVLVIHDGDHTARKVKQDIDLYHTLVSVGSYLIVEDGVIDLCLPGDGIGTHEEGPMFAIAAFLKEHPNFEIDPALERYLITYNPTGFLKRHS